MEPESNQRGDGQARPPADEPPARQGRPRRSRKALVLFCALSIVLAGVLYRNSRTPIVREWLIQCLGMVGPRAAPLLAREIRNNDDPQVFGAAIGELSQMKAAASPALIGALLDEDDPEKRGPLIYALGIIGWGDRDVMAVILAASHSDPAVRRRAVETLPIVCGPETAVPVLVKALQDPDGAVQLEAAKSLASYGPSAAPATAALESLARSSDPELHRQATETLGLVRRKR